MSSDAKIIYADPVKRLADSLRDEAAHHREQWADEERAAALEQLAKRVDAAVESGAAATWVPVADVAALLRKHPETIRARCRKVLKPAGLARKSGGDWLVHVNALAA